MTNSFRFRPDINALRALAILLVLLYHFKIPGFGGGFLGVDVFFVISGYLMTKIVISNLSQGRLNYFRFVSMRIARVWPALIVMIAILLALGALLLPPPDYQAFAEQAWTALLFYSNIHYNSGGAYFLSGPDERWLLHTWSLSVEWQFYLVYPLILGAANRLRTKFLSKVSCENFMFALVAGMAAASFALSVWLMRSDNMISAFFSIQSRMWEMLAGGGALLLESRFAGVETAYRRRCQMICAFLLLLVTMVAGVLHWDNFWPGVRAAAPVALTFLILALGWSGSRSPADTAPDTALSNIVQRIGLWSYSIYLWHWPIVVATNFADLEPQWGLPAKLVGVALSFILGYSSYRWVEQPTRFKRRDSTFQTSVRAATATLLLSAGASAAAMTSDGWITRTGVDQNFYRAYGKIKRSQIIPSACQNYKEPKERLKLCTLHGNEHGPRVLVYGDSHAQHLYTWFAEHAMMPVDFFTSSGCPPIPGFNRREGGFHCDDFVREALRHAALPEYSVIVVAGDWAGAQTLCASSEGICRDKRKPLQEVQANANAKAWDEIARAGKTVVVIDQSPVAAFNVFTKVMRRRFLGLAPLEHFIDIHAPAPGSKSYLDAVFALGGSAAIHRVSLRSELCVSEKCRIAVSDERPALMDQSHFAPWWISEHGQRLGAYLGRVLN